MPQRQTAHVPSHVLVGQPLYIFDVGTYKFDGTLYRPRAHTHTSSLSSILWTPQADDTSTLFLWIAPSIYMIYPGLYFTHIACKILFEMSSTQIPTNIFTKSTSPPKTKNTHECTRHLSRFVSLTHTNVGGGHAQREEVHARRTYSRLFPNHTRVGTWWSSFLYEKAAHVVI